MRVMTDMPERISGRRSCPGSKAMRTGMRWTTLVKLPDEVSLGSREKVAPVAGEMLSTWPLKVWPGKVSMRISTGCPARMLPIWVSL